ncbi:nucleotidyltransferase domain-containing protein [Natrinema versiforme]|uniref:DNA polymerase subunit beta n=1 Tax=Natrinema versiforme TaxID=88724 RepID=A0A4P8WN05_9EURY|nr:nucleotidyltransferase domain-containing protein [Natrinema versiforme]QCS44997.1 DNA polymerase subunit beta [Natrinema versiforme]
MGSKSIQRGASLELAVPVPSTDLFSHACTGEILTLLVDNPYTAFGIRDLSRATDNPHRSISAAVDDLEAVGFVEIEHSGRKKLVQINRARLSKPNDPIIQIPQTEFHAPVRELVSRLTNNVDDIHGIVLFGSVAQGNADRRSDIDCFVLVDGTQATAQQTADELTSELNEEAFDGDRYKFHVLVESVESARRYGDRLREIFATGLTLEGSDSLTQLKEEVLTNGR